MSSKRKYYAVHGSAHQGVYQSWNECKPFCLGKRGVKFKGFKDRETAEYFAKEGKLPEVECQEGVLTIFTDGACNDRNMAGVGVYFPGHEEWNISEPLRVKGEKTNQRAEIWAIIRSTHVIEIENVPRTTDIHIYTDSSYCCKAYWFWVKNWKRNGWKTSQGTDVKNRDLLEIMYQVLTDRNAKLIHVNSHCGIKGNEEADKLAVAGCFMK